jgi:multisubunit Na+/H+ antiporter MnhB subunit
MQERTVTIPDLALIAGTRIALGAGIGLLLADKLNEDQRKGAGWALLAVGILTTIPLMMNVLGKGSVPQRISE